MMGTFPLSFRATPITLPTVSPLPLASLDPRLKVQVDAPSAERPGGPLDSGANKDNRTANDPEGPDLDVDPTQIGDAQGRGLTER